MKNNYIVIAYTVIDDVLKPSESQDVSCTTGDSIKILTAAVIAVKYFQNDQQQALVILSHLADVPRLRVSRFNQGLHTLQVWLAEIRKDWMTGTCICFITNILPTTE